MEMILNGLPVAKSVVVRTQRDPSPVLSHVLLVLKKKKKKLTNPGHCLHLEDNNHHSFEVTKRQQEGLLFH